MIPYNILFVSIAFVSLSFIGQHASPQTLGSPNPLTQCLELHDLAVINENVDFGTIVFDV